MAFRSEVIKSQFENKKVVLFALFPLNKIVVQYNQQKMYLLLYANVLLWMPLGLCVILI
jgi:hypothetical protein